MKAAYASICNSNDRRASATFINSSLTPWSQRVRLCVSKLRHHWFGRWLVASSAPNHRPNKLNHATIWCQGIGSLQDDLYDNIYIQYRFTTHTTSGNKRCCYQGILADANTSASDMITVITTNKNPNVFVTCIPAVIYMLLFEIWMWQSGRDTSPRHHGQDQNS